MRLAVVPPEYFPGLSVAALLMRVDVVVLADTFRYVRQSRQNRAALRTPDGRQWITVPVGHGQHGQSIAATRIRETGTWQERHLKALRFNYGSTPYYEHYIGPVGTVITGTGGWLADLTVPATRLVGDLLDVRSTWIRASELRGAPSDLPGILEAAGGGTLVVPEGIPARGVSNVARLRFRSPVYRQRFEGFVGECSALDLLMLHGPAAGDVLESASRVC